MEITYRSSHSAPVIESLTHTKLFVIHNITSLHTKSHYYVQYHIIACDITETILLLQITVVTHYVHNLIVKSEIANKRSL